MVMHIEPEKILNKNIETVKGAFVGIQLQPPSCESRSSKTTTVESVSVEFSNRNARTQDNISIRLRVPFVTKVSCDSDRVKVVEGPKGADVWSGIVHLVASELAPLENQNCELILLNHAKEGTPSLWRQVYGNYAAYSDSQKHIPTLLYRLHYGPEEDNRVNKLKDRYAKDRPITIETTCQSMPLRTNKHKISNGPTPSRRVQC